jgi:hypothetical protein
MIQAGTDNDEGMSLLDKPLSRDAEGLLISTKHDQQDVSLSQEELKKALPSLSSPITFHTQQWVLALQQYSRILSDVENAPPMYILSLTTLQQYLHTMSNKT